MKKKQLLENYFRFSHKDRIGIIVLLLLMVFIFLVPRFYAINGSSKGQLTDTTWIAAIRELELRDSGNEFRSKYPENHSQFGQDKPARSSRLLSKELFDFDPNETTESDWRRLGLREKTIGIILNYLNKGGHFRKPDDFQRVYGLFPDEYKRLLPYIRIKDQPRPKYEPSTYQRSGQVGPGEDAEHSEGRFRKSVQQTPSIVNINLADSNDLIRLPGIGSKLANRILLFREKLGGFYRIEQVAETFGLTDSVFQKIRPFLQLSPMSLRKININTATLEELKAHPYIRYVIAGPLLAYRNAHGGFGAVEDIRKVAGVTEEVYRKLVAYLVV